MAKVKKAKKEKKKEQVSDSEEIIFAVNKNDTNRFVIAKNVFKGNKYLNIRLQYLNEDEDEWRFTAKGVSIPYKNDIALNFMKKARKFFKKETG